MHPPEPRPRGGWFFFGVFVISVVATALVVAQGLMYGLHDLPTLARDAGFASFAAWLLAAFWSLFATEERGAAKPWRARAAELLLVVRGARRARARALPGRRRRRRRRSSAPRC